MIILLSSNKIVRKKVILSIESEDPDTKSKNENSKSKNNIKALKLINRKKTKLKNTKRPIFGLIIMTTEPQQRLVLSMLRLPKK